MIFVEICVGSSCHIKGAPHIVELLQKKITEYGLEDKIVLSGRFCTGKCNRVGVTVTVGDEVCVGVTSENFNDFWNMKVLPKIKEAE